MRRLLELPGHVSGAGRHPQAQVCIEKLTATRLAFVIGYAKAHNLQRRLALCSVCQGRVLSAGKWSDRENGMWNFSRGVVCLGLSFALWHTASADRKRTRLNSSP